MPKTTTNQKDKTVTPQASAKTAATAPTQPTITEVLDSQLAQDPQLALTLPWASVEPAYQRVISRVARNMRHDGFRPGRVPVSIAEQRVNREFLIQEVLKQVLPPIFQQELAKSDVKPAAEPEMLVTKADKGEDWQVTALLPQRPEVKLPTDYQKFLKDHKQQALKTIAKAEADAAKETKETQTPALTDEQKQARATDEALMALLQEIKPAVSSVLVRRTAQRDFQQLHQRLAQYNMTYADYLKNTGMTDEIVGQQYTLHALENLQMEFILDALLEAEKVTVTDDELKAKMAEVMPNVTEPDEQTRQLQEPSVRGYLELMAKRQKLSDWLLSL